MGLSSRFHSFSELVSEELAQTVPSPIWRIRAILSGHPSRSMALLPPDIRSSGAFLRLTLFQRRRRFYNRMLYSALHNKISQKLWLDKICPEAAPPMTHYVSGNRLIRIGGKGKPVGTRSEVSDLVRSDNPIFIKPADAGRGVGAYQVSSGKEGVLINGNFLGNAAFQQWIRELPLSFTISNVIEQSKETRSFFPGALNTVRIMTATSFLDYRAVVLGAVLKCATSRSIPTDNFKSGAGGTVSSIDLETGVLGPCVGFDEARFERTLSDTHPETGAVVAGEILPHWQELHEKISWLASILPRPGVVGWDVAVRDNGITVVEINTLPGIDAVQSGVSLLDTEAKRRILSEMRMI
ncbi:MAG: hypothetical protein CL535_23540 [Ahrensia sp.]|nr:hypothetical protein [Ahrensia sp.]